MPNDFVDLSQNSNMADEEAAPTPKQVRVKPKMEAANAPHFPHPKPNPGNSAYEEPMAAKLLQLKVKRYLNKKKFLTITLSDVQSEIGEMEKRVTTHKRANARSHARARTHTHTHTRTQTCAARWRMPSRLSRGEPPRQTLSLPTPA